MRGLYNFPFLFILSFLNLHLVCNGHKVDKQVCFQGKRSLLSLETLLKPFPMKMENDPPIEKLSKFKSYEVVADLTADREFISDGGSVKIMARLQGILLQNEFSEKQ